MSLTKRLLPALAAIALAACAGTVPIAPPLASAPGWTPAEASTRPVGLGLPGGAELAEGVTFAGGIELAATANSPLHSLSDFKLLDDGFVSVSDAGDLVWGRLILDDEGRLTGLSGLRTRRLTLTDGSAIVDKTDGDAEGLLITAGGDLLVSFERDHRLWDYGPPHRLAARPRPVTAPQADFGPNDGMEGVTAFGGGWRVAGESGGVWDCAPRGCRVVTPPPATPIPDSEYRITGMDRDPSGDGVFVVQRLFRPPVDARAQVRRMAPDGTLGPMLVELKLPGTTDNFEGVAAVRRGNGVRLYILSDDNANPVQRTLLLAFDISSPS